MTEKWIGQKVTTSGSYYPTKYNELIKRKGYKDRSTEKETLYRFNTRFGEEYLISDEELITKIEEILNSSIIEPMKMYELLYGAIAEHFGIMEIILNYGHHTRSARESGYQDGIKRAQEDMRKALGIV